MARMIHPGGSIRLSGKNRVFLPGQEKELREAIKADTADENTPTPDVEMLEKKGVLSGFSGKQVAPKVEDEEEGEEGEGGEPVVKATTTKKTTTKK